MPLISSTNVLKNLFTGDYMKVVVLIIMLAFDPQPIILQVLTPNMMACQAARRSMPTVIKVRVKNVIHMANVLGATCKKVQKNES